MQSEKICYLLRWPHHWHIILHISNHPHRVPGAVHQQPGSTVEVMGHLHADTLLLWASSWFSPDDIIMFLPPSREQIHMWVVLWTLYPLTAFAVIYNEELSVSGKLLWLSPCVLLHSLCVLPCSEMQFQQIYIFHRSVGFSAGNDPSVYCPLYAYPPVSPSYWIEMT
jgi:hypothetical protein